MLNLDAVRAASDFLFEKWTALERIDQLPEPLRPASRHEGYAIQAEIEHKSAFPLFGWKIAATSEAGQKHIGVTGPMAGRILHEKVLPAHAAVSLHGNLMRVAEVEFAFKMDKDLMPRPATYTQDEVLQAVASLHPALEMPDSRFDDFVQVGAYQLIADNACAHLFMLGEATDAEWRQIDLSTFSVAVNHIRNGQAKALTGQGSNVLGDPRKALLWIANELTQSGVALRAGQVITTGTCLTPVQVEAGDRIEADFAQFGFISASFI